MIEALQRATRILDLFSTDVPEWTITDMARALALPKTTVWDHVQSMAELGLLRRTDRTHYRLGWRAFQMGLTARATSEIASAAREVMAQLAEEFGETVSLTSRYGEEVVYLEKTVPRTGLRTQLNRIGARLPAADTAAGRAILQAPLPDPGFTVEKEEHLEGLCVVAAPITNRHREAVWSLSMSFAEYKFAEHHQRYGAAIREAAVGLSHKMLLT